MKLIAIVAMSSNVGGSLIFDRLGEAAALPDVKVFHAGTAAAGEEIRTNGGRVLGVTALGTSIAAARAKAYGAVNRIHFAGMQYRRDIASKALAIA